VRSWDPLIRLFKCAGSQCVAKSIPKLKNRQYGTLSRQIAKI
jgi:hypothetical protein